MCTSKQNNFWKSSIFLTLLLVGCGGGSGAPVSSPDVDTPDNAPVVDNGTNDAVIDNNSDSYKTAFQNLADFMRTTKDDQAARKRMTLDDFQNVGFDEIDSPEKLDAVLYGIQADLIHDKEGNNRFLLRHIEKAIFEAGLDLYINEPAETFIFKGLEYGIVSSEYTGKRWLDRNLGAKKVCIRYRFDQWCHGDYYQWGRPADGHETIFNHTGEDDLKKYWKSTKEISTTIKPEHDKIISGREIWTSADEEGLERSAFWKKSDGNGVCPNGFRVPTRKELLSELNTPYRSDANRDYPFFERLRSFLRVGLGGERGAYTLSGYNKGGLWTTDVTKEGVYESITHWAVSFNNSNSAVENNADTSDAINIRCIED